MSYFDIERIRGMQDRARALADEMRTMAGTMPLEPVTAVLAIRAAVRSQDGVVAELEDAILALAPPQHEGRSS